jgi:predicted ribosomally synthesized peptide with SipW-like signal peptide
MRASLPIIAGLIVLSVVSTTMAIFTDQVVVGSNTFSTATVDISATPASSFISFTSMLPGDTVTQPLTVSNSGTADFRYAATSTATNPDGKNLAGAINLIVKTQGTSCSAFDGTTLYSGALNGFAFGNPAPGNQSGDRTLTAGSSEVLCFRASLPIGTGNTYQNATTTFSVTFDAEQTANNP